MRQDDIFSDISDNTAFRLSREYPVLNNEQKERLYAMSKRKYNINDMQEDNALEVSGVERYRRPKWYNGASIAAAAVLLVAGIGGSMAFISRNGHSPAAEVESSIAETTEAVTEEVTEEITEIAEETEPAEEVDANAIAKELTGASRELMCDLYAGNLEVDKSSVVTKTVTLPDGYERQREFYRVTDSRYPTWADIEKRCYEIFDAELGNTVLDNCLCASEEDINYETFMYTADGGYYIEKDRHDSGEGSFLDECTVKGDIDENGNIIATLNEINTNVEPNSVLESKFTIVNTENGWRINSVDEKLYFANESDNNDINAQ